MEWVKISTNANIKDHLGTYFLFTRNMKSADIIKKLILQI